MAKGTASLFHPKPSRPTLPKKDSPSTNTPSPGPSQSTTGTPKKATTPAARPLPQQAPRRLGVPPIQKPKADDDEKKQALPDGPYAEFRLMSSKLNGWKYDVMKFESRKRVDINTWAAPVKLNRKEPRREDAPDAASLQAVSAMVGSDGKLVIGADGKVVMVDAAGRPVRAPVDADEAGEEKGKGKDKKKRFVKKTRQVFLVPEETRQLRREERHPWVMEDAKHEETWVGKMEEVSKSQTHAMFMPAADDVFKFVPAHRWYKFQKKPHYHIPNLEEAETLMTKMQKHKDTHWTLRQRTEQGSGGSSLVHSAGTSLGPGGRKLRTVDNGPSELFGGDDDEDGGDSKRRAKRELGAEGDLDELDFEDTFADDEEKMDLDDKEDDETKELEERLKKEYKNANKLREGHIDESDEEEEEAQLTGAGKNLQKTLKKLDKEGAYDDSDDEKNPYASEEEEEEEEEEVPIAPTGPAIQPVEPKPGARSVSQTSPVVQVGKPTANGQPPSTPKTTEPLPQSISRPTSPAPAPGHGGHSVVARRATSPKMPKLKTAIPSRAGSPLASPNGASPPASRATSPTAGNPTAPSTSGGAKALKRKATDDGSAGAAGGGPGSVPRPKKRKAQLPPGAELEDRMVIEWLRATPNATTRECILHFTPYLTDEEKKNKFTALVKEVAQLSKGVLVLRPAYRGAATAPSPAG